LHAGDPDSPKPLKFDIFNFDNNESDHATTGFSQLKNETALNRYKLYTKVGDTTTGFKQVKDEIKTKNKNPALTPTIQTPKNTAKKCQSQN